MKPSEFYEKLLSEVDDDLAHQVLDVLSARIGEKITREELILHVFGIADAGDLASSIEDRKVRRAIEMLRDKSFPILSTSGEAGYSLVDDPDLLDAHIAEEYSRIEHIRHKITMLLRAKSSASMLHEWRQATSMPVQGELFRLDSRVGSA